MKSKYGIASIGIAVETKDDGSEMLLVSPVEIFYDQPTGKIKDKKTDYQGSKTGLSGVDINTEHESTNYIRARWRPIGSNNRVTPPDIYQGERVVLYNYEGTEHWYWDNLGNEPTIRGLEDVVYLYSNLKGGGGGQAYNMKNSYWIRWNTKKKFIHLHTSKNDGEACEYDVIIDTGKGTITTKDDLGNSITLNSPKGSLSSLINELVYVKTKKIHHVCEDYLIDCETYTQNATSVSRINTPVHEISDHVRIGNTLKTGSHIQCGGNLMVAGSIASGAPGGMRSMRSMAPQGVTALGFSVPFKPPMLEDPETARTTAQPTTFSSKQNDNHRPSPPSGGFPSGSLGRGAVIYGNVEIRGTLKVTGDVTFTSNLNVSGRGDFGGTVKTSWLEAPNNLK